MQQPLAAQAACQPRVRPVPYQLSNDRLAALSVHDGTTCSVHRPQQATWLPQLLAPTGPLRPCPPVVRNAVDLGGGTDDIVHNRLPQAALPRRVPTPGQHLAVLHDSQAVPQSCCHLQAQRGGRSSQAGRHRWTTARDQPCCHRQTQGWSRQAGRGGRRDPAPAACHPDSTPRLFPCDSHCLPLICARKPTDRHAQATCTEARQPGTQPKAHTQGCCHLPCEICCRRAWGHSHAQSTRRRPGAGPPRPGALAGWACPAARGCCPQT